MKKASSTRGRTVAVLFVVAAGLTLSTVGASVALGVSGNRSMEPAPVYQKNERGMTYGSGLDAPSIDVEPDLIEAIGADGTAGYVRSDDLVPPLPTSLEEAATSEKYANRARTIPLYAVDGTTVIGTFEILPSEELPPDGSFAPRS